LALNPHFNPKEYSAECKQLDFFLKMIKTAAALLHLKVTPTLMSKQSPATSRAIAILKETTVTIVKQVMMATAPISEETSTEVKFLTRQ